MPKIFYCKYCNYKTSKKSSFNNHLGSKKHVKYTTLYKLNENGITCMPKIGQEIYPPGQKNCPIGQKNCLTRDVLCEYCNKHISTVKNLKQHYKLCKEKKIYDVQEKLKQQSEVEKIKLKKELEAKKKAEQRLKKEVEQQKEKLEELEEVQSDYYDLLRQIAKSKTSPQTINLHYVVNNFTEALNYEDLMTPKLTDKEVDEVKQLEPMAGTINIIEKRCITGMDVKKRPLHCLDTSRNKYLVRTDNEWVVDHHAKRIFKGAAKHIHDMYATNPITSNLSLEQIMRNQQKLLKLESKSSKNKMIKDLNDKVYIKNIKIESIVKN